MHFASSSILATVTIIMCCLTGQTVAESDPCGTDYMSCIKIVARENEEIMDVLHEANENDGHVQVSLQEYGEDICNVVSMILDCAAEKGRECHHRVFNDIANPDDATTVLKGTDGEIRIMDCGLSG